MGILITIHEAVPQGRSRPHSFEHAHLLCWQNGVAINHPYLDDKDHSQEETGSRKKERSVTKGKGRTRKKLRLARGSAGPVHRPSGPNRARVSAGQRLTQVCVFFFDSLISHRMLAHNLPATATTTTTPSIRIRADTSKAGEHAGAPEFSCEDDGRLDIG